MRIMAQVAMVMNLDKCIGCHTCSVTCKQVWTNRPGTEYVYFNNVETKPGVGWTQAIGIPENVYRWFSAGAGTLAAVLVIGGVIVLATRRLLVPLYRATTAPVDDVTLILLLIVILTGIAPTIGINLFGHGYNYRTTVAPWFRSLFTGSPDVQAIAHAPFIYQLHATAAWMIWALWPFSSGARLELPAVVPVATLHRLPQPPARPAPRARYRRAQMAQDRCPVLSAPSPPGDDHSGRAREAIRALRLLRSPCANGGTRAWTP